MKQINIKAVPIIIALKNLQTGVPVKDVSSRLLGQLVLASLLEFDTREFTQIRRRRQRERHLKM